MIDTKALREKILDLAIRGKLVPQDPNDEPASVLLERIRTQKQQMVKEGKLKAKDIKNDTIIFKGEDNLHYEQFRDGTVKCIEDEIPFEIPESWEWCRFLSGFIINPRNSIQDNIEVSFIPMPLIQEGYTNNHKSEIRLWKKVKTGYTHFAENDIAIAKITPCFENKKSVVFKNLSNGYGAGTTELHIIRTLENTVLPEYVLWYIKRDDFISDGINAFSGAVGQKRIGREFIEQYLIPLPPVSEQEKILEAIHTAFMSIDSIECSYTKLNALITIAKSKILDLAIRGKLVPQDPNDEPASVLLERIKAEKEELIKQGKIKRDKKESVIFKGEDNSYYEKIGNSVACIDDELPFEIPSSWIWCRGYSCFSGMETRSPNGDFFKYIDIDSIDNKLHKIKCPKVIATKDAPSRANRGVQTGSVLFAFVRPYLENIAYVDEQNKDCIASTGFYVCNSNGALYPLFMYYLMISEYVVQGLNQFMKGDNSPSISKGNIENWLYPIPPSNEQKRICSKLEELIELTLTVEKSLS